MTSNDGGMLTQLGAITRTNNNTYSFEGCRIIMTLGAYFVSFCKQNLAFTVGMCMNVMFQS